MSSNEKMMANLEDVATVEAHELKNSIEHELEKNAEYQSLLQRRHRLEERWQEIENSARDRKKKGEESSSHILHTTEAEEDVLNELKKCILE